MRMRDYDALVDRLESQVDSPGYKIRVRLWMWLGSLVLLAGVLLVAAFAVGFIALLILGKLWIFVLKGIKLVLVALVALGALVKSLWIRADPPEGEELTRREQPQLFARLDAIAEAAGSPLPDRVVLTDELNAAVVSDRPWGPLPIYRHTLVLGLPLMDALTPEELDAVIGHELGHLSRSHAAFGARVYRTRLAWLRVQGHLERHSEVAGSLGSRFIAWYAPRFAAMTHVLARRNEYEADRVGASLASAQACVDALVRSGLADRRADAELWDPMNGRPLELERPPVEVYEELAAIVRSASEDERAGRWLDEAQRRYTDSIDTHPSLSDRAAALGAELRVPPPLIESAAERYLGPAVGAFRAQMSRDWARDWAEPWSEMRPHLLEGQALAERLERKDPGELTQEESQQLMEHYLLLARDEDVRRVARLRCESHPEVAEANLDYGRSLLTLDDERGVALVRKAIALDPDWAIAGHDLLASFYRRRGEREAADEAYAALEEHAEARRAYLLRLAEVDQGEALSAPALPDDQMDRLVELFAADEHLTRVWVAARDRTERGDRPHVIVVEVRPPFTTLRREDFRQEMVERLASQIDFLTSPFLVFARKEHPWLDKKIEKVEGACVVAR